MYTGKQPVWFFPGEFYANKISNRNVGAALMSQFWKGRRYLFIMGLHCHLLDSFHWNYAICYYTKLHHNKPGGLPEKCGENGKVRLSLEIRLDSFYNRGIVEIAVDEQIKTEKNLYSIVFKGEVRPGVDRNQAIVNLASFYKIEPAKVAPLFSGKRFTLKENLTFDAARKYLDYFEKVGILCTVVKKNNVSSGPREQPAAAQVPPPAQKPSPPAAPQPSSPPSPTPAPPPPTPQPTPQPAPQPLQKAAPPVQTATPPQAAPEPLFEGEQIDDTRPLPQYQRSPQPKPQPPAQPQVQQQPQTQPQTTPEPPEQAPVETRPQPVIEQDEPKPEPAPEPKPEPKLELKPEPGLPAPAPREIYFRLVFSGEPVQGKTVEEAKVCMSNFYKVEPGKINHLFTGQPITLREPLDFWSAAVFWKKLYDCGGVCHIEPATSMTPPAAGPGKYKMVFSGTAAPGADIQSVREHLARLFRVPVNETNCLFTGNFAVLKTNLTIDESGFFKANLEKTGAMCQLLDADAVPPAEARPPAPEEPAAQPEPALKQTVLTPQKPAETPETRPMPPLAATPAPVPDEREPGMPGVAAAPPQAQSPPIETSQPAQTAQQPIDSMPHRQPVAQDNQFTFRKQKASSKAPILIVLGVIIVGIVLILIPKGSSSDDENVITQPARPPVRKRARPPAAKRTSPIPVKKPSVLSSKLTSYSDEAGYYSISLPEGFDYKDKSVTNKSKTEFNYKGGIQVIITAEKAQGVWNPEKEMKKTKALADGDRSAIYPKYLVENFGLIHLNGLPGYEITLLKGDHKAHIYSIANSEIVVTIEAITSGKNYLKNHDILDKIIRKNLSVF